MEDELNLEGDLPESRSDSADTITSEAESVADGDGLEIRLAEKAGALEAANVRITELEQAISDRDEESASVKQSLAEVEEKLMMTANSLADAVGSYRTLVVQANPHIMEELISGDSIEAVDQSLEKAEALVSKVRQGLEAEVSLTRVPAGAPERRSPDLSALLPRDKIKYAIGGK